jgi:uncharacterized RDD family membrane protein YckC/predicted nucleic acid-binding Zn ribbon protein
VARLIINPTAANRREIPLVRDQIVTIGRDPSNDLVLPDAMVSRRHAVIEPRGSQFFLRDCNSANGSVVNGDRVSERGLRDGDLVAIGSMRLLFREEPVDPGAKVVPHPSAAPLHCPSCGAEYRRGDLFCRDCGAQVAKPTGPPKAVCSSCGTAVPLPARFCSACGRALPEGRGRGEAGGEKAADVERAEPGGGGLTPSPARQDTRPAPSVPEREEGPRRGGSAAVPALEPRPAVPGRATDPAHEVRLRAGRPLPGERRPPTPVAPRRTASGAVRSAGLGRRLVAGVVDAVFVASGQAVMLVPVAYYWWSREPPPFPGDVSFVAIVASVALVVLAALLGALYHVYFWGVRGSSPGKELLELGVETEDGVSPIGLGRASLRLLGYVLSAATFGIGFLMIASGNGGLHDRIAGTRVVRRSRP